MSLDTHRHKKQLGQHFLSSPGIVEKIIRAVAPKPGEFIVEIGPGGGALTFPCCVPTANSRSSSSTAT